MKPFRSTHVVAMAMLTVLAAGCSAGSDTADEPQSTQPAMAGTAVDLDGVRFDVRRDPG